MSSDNIDPDGSQAPLRDSRSGDDMQMPVQMGENRRGIRDARLLPVAYATASARPRMVILLVLALGALAVAGAVIWIAIALSG